MNDNSPFIETCPVCRTWDAIETIFEIRNKKISRETYHCWRCGAQWELGNPEITLTLQKGVTTANGNLIAHIDPNKDPRI